MTSRYSMAATRAYGCALAICILPSLARADWESTPDLRMEIEANDNPRLGQRPDRRVELDETGDHTATRMLLDARVRLRNAGPRGDVQIQPRVRVDTYSDAADNDLERQDVYLNSRASYRWPRTTAGLRLNLNRESIISAELSDTGALDPDDPVGGPIDDPIANETGLLVLLDEFRNRATLAPYAEFSISERSAVLLQARHIDVSYTGPDLRGRTDFSDTSLSLGVGRTIDDRTRATASMIVSRFEADETRNETDTVGVEGSFDRDLSEIWSFNLTTGLQRSDFTFVDDNGEPVDNAATNYTLSIGFAKRTELSSLDIRLFRLLNPNAVGFLVKRNELRVGFSRQLSERVRAGIGLRAMETGALERGVNDREYIRVDFDVEWAFTPSWSFAARLGGADQKFAGEQRLDGTATVLSIGAVYRGISQPGR